MLEYLTASSFPSGAATIYTCFSRNLQGQDIIELFFNLHGDAPCSTCSGFQEIDKFMYSICINLFKIIFLYSIFKQRDKVIIFILVNIGPLQILRAIYLYGPLGLMRAKFLAPEANACGQHWCREYSCVLVRVRIVCSE